MRIRMSVGITIRIITGWRITTGIIRKMGITVIIKNRIHNNNKYNNSNDNIKKNNKLRAHWCWKTGQTDTWTDP
jgi:hypothetical protein